MRHIGAHCVLVVLSTLFIAPLAWMVSSSMKSPGEAIRHPFALPATVHISNYAESVRAMGAFNETDPTTGFARLAVNTVVVTMLAVVFNVFTCSLAGYAFARLRFRGKSSLFLMVLTTMMLPVMTVVLRFLPRKISPMTTPQHNSGIRKPRLNSWVCRARRW